MKKLLLGAALSLFMFQAHAATVELPNVDSGWYTKPGLHSASIKNYYASENNGQRNFFVFDISSLDAKSVTGASFTFYTATISDAGTFTLFDVTTPSNLLSAQTPAGPAGAAINQDLGDGDIYGSALLNPSDSNSFVTITLNQKFIDALKLANNTISMGGTFAGTTNTAAYAFASSSFNTGNVLTVTTVPEAGKASMLGLGLVMIGAAASRRKRQ